jgi:hypothetical protein
MPSNKAVISKKNIDQQIFKQHLQIIKSNPLDTINNNSNELASKKFEQWKKKYYI